MSIREVPAKIFVICDRCKIEGERDRGPFRDASASVKNLKFFYRTSMGDARHEVIDVDLCRVCAFALKEFLGGKELKE